MYGENNIIVNFSEVFFMSRGEIKRKAREQLGSNIFAEQWLYAIVAILMTTALMAIGGPIMILTSGPLLLALFTMFLKQSRDGKTMDFTTVFDGFKSFEQFKQLFVLEFVSGLIIGLWSLLFVIPGIVKAYSYSMAIYIRIDHPEYDWKKCLEESRKMMDGKKWTLFIQDLSFIGWLIVGCLCFGIGVLFVYPYVLAARAQFYRSIAGDPLAEAPAEEQPAEQA